MNHQYGVLKCNWIRSELLYRSSQNTWRIRHTVSRHTHVEYHLIITLYMFILLILEYMTSNIQKRQKKKEIYSNTFLSVCHTIT